MFFKSIDFQDEWKLDFGEIGLYAIKKSCLTSQF